MRNKSNIFIETFCFVNNKMVLSGYFFMGNKEIIVVSFN